MRSVTYSTLDIAEFLGIKRQQVVYYIKAGYLKAEKIGKYYHINFMDYLHFKDDYFIPEKFNKQRGPKTLTEEAVEILKNVVKDLEDKSISYKEFCKKHNEQIYILPHAKIYLRYKRDQNMRADKEKGIDTKTISKKYGLSLIRTREILKEEVEDI